MSSQTQNLSIVSEMRYPYLTYPLSPYSLAGPTLLFERVCHKDKGTVDRFYACSACRDRRGCSFFQRVGDKVSPQALKAREQANQDKQPRFTHEQYFNRFVWGRLVVSLHVTMVTDHYSVQFITDSSKKYHPSSIDDSISF